MHVALVGLLFMPFSGFLFVSARLMPVLQCEFRGPFEVEAVGKEKSKGTSPRLTSGDSDRGLGSSFFEGNLLCGEFFDPGGSLLCSRSAVHAHLTSGRAFDLRWTCV